MNWFAEHVYVAAWMSPVIALIAMIVQAARPAARETNWAKVMIFIAFLTCLAAVFTPMIDPEARIFAGFVVLGGGFYIGALGADAEERK